MIKIIEKDIFKSGADVICHQVNCQGVMGSGIAKTVKNLYPDLFLNYKYICDNRKDKLELLGSIYTYIASDNTMICNLFSQNNFGYDGKCYTNYNALTNALINVNLISTGKTVAIPYLMGCDRGGGNWNIVTKIIEDNLKDCDVTFYKYKK